MYRIATKKVPKTTVSRQQAANDRESKKVTVETLHNLSDDIGEETNWIDQRPELAAQLKKRMEAFHEDLRHNTRPAADASQP